MKVKSKLKRGFAAFLAAALMFTSVDLTAFASAAGVGHDSDGTWQVTDAELVASYVEEHDAKAATCLSYGWDKYYTCSNCEYTTYDVIDKLGNYSAKEASNYSHGDMPWMIAEDNDELDYEYVFYRDPEYSVRDYDREVYD